MSMEPKTDRPAYKAEWVFLGFVITMAIIVTLHEMKVIDVFYEFS